MRFLRSVIVLLLIFGSLPLEAQEKQVYFSISTDKTFQPGEKPKVRLYAHNVETMEFRVYRINDAVKFFQQLSDVHRFGPIRMPKEQVDEKSWLERFHDWKHNLWVRFRDFIREQFSPRSRAQIRDRHSASAQRGKTPVSEFARIPLLNASQLVARWKVNLPSALVSESSDLPIDSLESGVYLVEVTDGTYKAYTVLIVTRMAVITKSSPGHMLVYTADRNSGLPMGNAKVMVWRKKLLGEFKTAENGLGELQTSVENSDEAQAGEDGESYGDGTEWALAQSGKEVALVAPYYSSFSLSSNPAADWLGYIYTERPVYRPGHTVQFKAVLRKRNGDTIQLPTDREVKVEIKDSTQAVLLRKQLSLSAFGTVHGSLELPTNAALGSYSIQVSNAKGLAYGNFEVEEYKKPEYWVKVTPEKPRTLQGDKVKATIEARYFFGEPVANATVKYVVHTERRYWWEDEYEESQEPEPGAEASGEEGGYYYGGTQVLDEEGKLDANGRLVITIPTKIEDKKFDVNYRIEARVTDAGNREISGHNAVLATYGSYRVAVQTQSYVYQQGETAPMTVKTVDYEDHPVQADVKVELVSFEFMNGRRDETVVKTLTARTGADGLVRVSLPLEKTGSFTVRATSHTPEGRDVMGSTWIWVTGKDASEWGGEERQVQLIADKGSYKVGDTAHVLVLDALPDSMLLVTSEGRTILSKQLVKAAGSQTMVDIPITKESQPNVFVDVAFLRNDKIYEGRKSLKVPAREQRLNIEITPSKAQFIPGEAATYTVTAKDVNGKPVQAELSVGVVDDAIYSVRPESSGDIVNAFYQQRYGEVITNNSLTFHFEGEAGKKSLQLADAGGAFRASRRSALAQIKAGDLVQPKIRKAFPDTAFWAAEVKTDSNGRAKVSMSFPDSLTTWRTTVRGITMDTKGGFSTNKVLVRKNLILRLAVPRFFRIGDEVTVSAIVHNYLESQKTVKVSLDATGITTLGGATRDLVVPSRGEAKLDWRLKAMPGKEVKLLAKALTNEESDAVELTLPIIPFGVKHTIARSGAISEQNGKQESTLEFPANSETVSRGIDVDLSPSLAGEIFGALDYLTSFPYGCTEQTMSSFLPNVVVASTLNDMKLKSNIDPATLRNQVTAGLDRLYDFQHEDGGWGWWKEDDSTVFMTAYVLSGLSQANAAGYTVHPYKISQAKDYLRKALAEHPKMIPDLRAYVVFALSQSGERDRKSLDLVWSSRDKLSAEGLAMAGLSMKLNSDSRAIDAASMLRSLAVKEGETVYWPAKNDNLLDIDTDSSPEGTAYVVKLLSAVDPNDPMLPQAVLWMMRHRNEGYYWSSTKQTAMIVYALVDYMKVSHELEGSFDAEVLVNGVSTLKKHLSAQDSETVSTKLHLDATQVAGKNQVEVRKSGSGRLYWSTSATYHSTDKKLFHNGTFSLNIARDYYKLVKSTGDGGKIVYDLQPLPGAVQVGDILALRVTVSGGRWKYLLIEDPIPAGTEFIQRDNLYELRSSPPWWRWWATRREFHDDRAAFFQSYFDQQQQFVYLLKVVNPGIFKTSPASVQPMYQPDVLSTTEPATLEVK